MIANILILLVATLSVVYVGLFVYAYFVSDALIFPAPDASYLDGPDILKLESPDGETISAYLLDAPDAEKLILYSHGNGEDIGGIRPRLLEFQKRGISVFTYDYPGYGTSTGRPSEKGTYAAAQAAYDYITQEKGYTPANIILYGRSLGSGPSCWLAERHPVSSMILDGAYSSTFRVLTRIKVLPFDKFDNIAILRHLNIPVLLVHGKQDTVVPFQHALKNEAALRGKAQTLWVESANHNNLIELAPNAYWDAVMKLIKNQPTQ